MNTFYEGKLESVLIGSTAINYRLRMMGLESIRKAKDLDFLVSEEGMPLSGPEPTDRVESFCIPHLAELPFGPHSSGRGIATLEDSLAIKMSHIYWDNNWSKHAKDIVYLLELGIQPNMPLHDALYPVWESHYGKKKANLNAEAEDFFNSNIKRHYDHDSIHHSVSYHDRPLFESILRDGSDVAVAKEKFYALSEEDKTRLIFEELYATALERYVVPSLLNVGTLTEPPNHSHRKSVHKLITSYSKGWFATEVALRLDKIIAPDVDYVQRFKDNQDRLIKLT